MCTPLELWAAGTERQEASAAGYAAAGHTHSIIDQRFSRISIRLHAKDAFTPDELPDVLEGMFTDTEPVVEVAHFIGFDDAHGLLGEASITHQGPGDFKGTFEPHIIPIEGYGTTSDGRR